MLRCNVRELADLELLPLVAFVHSDSPRTPHSSFEFQVQGVVTVNGKPRVSGNQLRAKLS